MTTKPKPRRKYTKGLGKSISPILQKLGAGHPFDVYASAVAEQGIKVSRATLYKYVKKIGNTSPESSEGATSLSAQDLLLVQSLAKRLGGIAKVRSALSLLEKVQL